VAIGEEETDIVERICSLRRHPNAAQTVRSKRYSVAWTKKTPTVETTQSPVETSVTKKYIHDGF